MYSSIMEPLWFYEIPMARRALTIKSIPESLYRRLKQKAAQHHRSINREVIVCLEQSLRSRRLDPTDFLAQIDTLRNQTLLPHLTEEDLKKIKTSGRP